MACEKKIKKGFTLIEVIMAMTIVAIGFTAVCMTLSSSHRVNAKNDDTIRALAYVNEIREYTMSLPFCDPETNDPTLPGSEEGGIIKHIDDVDDFHSAAGIDISPPIRRPTSKSNSFKPEIIPGSNDNPNIRWAQRVELRWVDPKDPNKIVLAGTSNLIKIKCTVTKKVLGSIAEEIYSSSWLVRNR